MKAIVNKAIKVAGLNKADFTVTSRDFESNLSTAKGNGQMNKVAEVLRKMGYKVGGYKTGYGAWVYTINGYRHSGHDADFNSTASVHHY